MHKQIKIFYFAIVFLFLITFVSGATGISYCCEKTIDGKSCVEVEQRNECSLEAGLGASPTSCSSTDYCKIGTCIDIVNGVCSPNTYKGDCENNGGTWNPEVLPERLPECQLGCCTGEAENGLIRDASFVYKAQCTKISRDLGKSMEFRTDIDDEGICLALKEPTQRGACVLTANYKVDCKMTTGTGCDNLRGAGGYSDVSFYPGDLCTNPNLGTDCVPTKKTTCVEGLDQVFFVDTCDNICNVYDANKIEDFSDYWAFIQEPSCTAKEAKKNPSKCGNCEYDYSTRCDSYERGGTNQPSYGDYVCKSLDCTDRSVEAVNNFYAKYGRTPYNAETWCGGEGTSDITFIENEEGEFDFGVQGIDQPGGVHVQYECREGEVTPVLCDTLREKVCAEGTFEAVGSDGVIQQRVYGSCIPNAWQNCVWQKTENSCEDANNGMCKWIEGKTFFINMEEVGEEDEKRSQPTTKDAKGEIILGACVPSVSPGFEFWKEDGGCEFCNNFGTEVLNVEYKADLIENRKKFEKDFSKKRDSCSGNCFGIIDYNRGDARNSWEKWYGKDKEKRDEQGYYSFVGESGDYEMFENYEDWYVTNAEICTALGDCGRIGESMEGDQLSRDYSNNKVKNFLGIMGQTLPIKNGIINYKFFNKPKKQKEEIEEAGTEAFDYEEETGGEEDKPSVYDVSPV